VSVFAYDRIAQKLPEAIAERYQDRSGAPWLVVQPRAIAAVISDLKNDPGLDFKLFLSMDCCDRLNLPEPTPRFEVGYFLYSISRNEHARIKVRAEDGKPEIPSVAGIFQGANWWERFVWDFYGVRFTGHPDLRRILLYEEFKGHPLRKDYALRERQPLIPERPIKDIFRGPGTSGVL
jgi:NADH-quinone oxidoreductase subunit C